MYPSNLMAVALVETSVNVDGSKFLGIGDEQCFSDQDHGKRKPTQQTTVEHNLNQFDFSHQHNHCFFLTVSIRMLCRFSDLLQRTTVSGRALQPDCTMAKSEVKISGLRIDLNLNIT